MKCHDCHYLIQSPLDPHDIPKCQKRHCYPDPFIERDCSCYKQADRLHQLRRMQTEKLIDFLIYPVEKQGQTLYLTRDEEYFSVYNSAFRHTAEWLASEPQPQDFY